MSIAVTQTLIVPAVIGAQRARLVVHGVWRPHSHTGYMFHLARPLQLGANDYILRDHEDLQTDEYTDNLETEITAFWSAQVTDELAAETEE